MPRHRTGTGAAVVVFVLLGAFAATAFAKPHHHKCKRTQATVKIRGKKLCKPIKSAFPKPRAGDERIAAWKTALNPAPGLRDRHGRKLLSPTRGHGPAGRKIYTAIAATMPEGLDRLDALAEAPQRPLLGRALASTSCKHPGTPTSAGFSRSVDGVRVDASFQESGNSKSMVFSAKSGDLLIRTSFERDTCSELKIPRCPTAAGAIDAKGTWIRQTEIRVLFFEGGDLVAQQVLSEIRRTDSGGQTAADAKLDHLDIHDALIVSIFSTNTGTTGGTHENFVLKRGAEVDM